MAPLWPALGPNRGVPGWTCRLIVGRTGSPRQTVSRAIVRRPAAGFARGPFLTGFLPFAVKNRSFQPFWVGTDHETVCQLTQNWHNSSYFVRATKCRTSVHFASVRQRRGERLLAMWRKFRVAPCALSSGQRAPAPRYPHIGGLAFDPAASKRRACALF